MTSTATTTTRNHTEEATNLFAQTLAELDLAVADHERVEPHQPLAIRGATPDAFGDYLSQLGGVELLTREQEVELAKRVEAGVFAQWKLDSGAVADGSLRRDLERIALDGRRARAHLVEANLRLVVWVARRYGGGRLPQADIVSEGNIGLVRAVEKFDYAKGFRFSTYAIWWIRQAIYRAISDQSRTIRVPAYMAELIGKVARAERELHRELDRRPNAEEIAARLGIAPDKVRAAQKYGREPVSLFTPIGWDGATELYELIVDTDAIEPADALAHALLRGQLLSLLDTMEPRAAGVIRMRFGLDDGRPMTLDEIGEVYGLPRERIRQIEAKAMAGIRHPSVSGRFRDYLN